MSSAMRVAQCCATCRFGRFERSTVPYGGHAVRRQTGLCMVFTELASQPPCPDNLQPVHYAYDFTRYPDGEWPSLEAYVAHYDGMIAHDLHTVADYQARGVSNDRFTRWVEEATTKRDAVIAHYHAQVAWITWWKDNIELTRRAHRITTCDAWEKGGHEPAAESIVKNANKNTRPTDV